MAPTRATNTSSSASCPSGLRCWLRCLLHSKKRSGAGRPPECRCRHPRTSGRAGFPKTAEVLIDGAYAGTVATLKSTLRLDPGAYNLCIKAAGHADYCRCIYVLSGKNLTVLAKLAPVPVEVNP